MRQRKGWIYGGVTLATGLSLAGVGCTGDSTLSELLSSLGLENATIEDVLGAIESFTGESASLPFGQELTAEQEAEIAALQEQHDAGEITTEEYIEALVTAAGIQETGMPFTTSDGRSFGQDGFPGGPQGTGGEFVHSPARTPDFIGAGTQEPGGLSHGSGPAQTPSFAQGGRQGTGSGQPVGRTQVVDLSDEQEVEAQEIFDAMRTDVVALQEESRLAIESLLSEEQIALLDELDYGHFTDHRAFGPGHTPDRLADELGLSEEQETQVQTLLSDLETAVEARREAARDSFRAILTEEQLSRMDEIASEGRYGMVQPTGTGVMFGTSPEPVMTIGADPFQAVP